LRVRHVVATDGHQHVDAQGGDVVEDVRGQVVQIVTDRVARCCSSIQGGSRPAHLRGLVREVCGGATGPLDRPGIDWSSGRR
jgi:hypothetical protein